MESNIEIDNLFANHYKKFRNIFKEMGIIECIDCDIEIGGVC